MRIAAHVAGEEAVLQSVGDVVDGMPRRVDGHEAHTSETHQLAILQGVIRSGAMGSRRPQSRSMSSP